MKKKRQRIKLDSVVNDNTFAPNTRPDPKTPVNPRTGEIPKARTPFPAAYGAVSSTPAGLSISQQPQSEAPGFMAAPKVQTTAVGNSGTQVYGGYFSEEYLSHLRGRLAAKQWDEMRRSEAQISMLLSAIINPIKAANWEIESPIEGNVEAEMHTDFIKLNLFENETFDWEKFKHEALTLVPFGFSLFEKVHSVVLDNERFGPYNGLKTLAFRSQKTIENWILEVKTGRLLGVNQYTFSDLGGNEFIPGEFLVVFSLAREGDNYEGISALRPMLGSYKRKELYLKLAAIGMEKYAIGTPVGTIPKGKERSPEVDEFKKVLASFTSHELAYITVPEGWTVDIKKGDFDASKLKELLAFENTEMANALVANFLALGMNGSGGAYALGSNLGEFFTTGIQSYADIICDVINKHIIPDLIILNYGKQSRYPKIKVTGIADKAGKELADAIKVLSDARVLDPDMPLKKFLRKQYRLPKPDVDTATAMPAIPAGASANYPKPNDPVVDPKTGKQIPFSPKQLAEHASTIQLADKKYVKQFDAHKASLKLLMQTNLKTMYEATKKKLRSNYNGSSDANKILAAKNLEIVGQSAYISALKDKLAEIAKATIKNSVKSLPKHLKGVKLAEGDYDGLPPEVKKLILAQANAINDAQTADMEKAIQFQFTSSALSSDDIDDILNDIDGNVDPMIEGSTSAGMNVDAAAGNAVSFVSSQASLSVFMAPDVMDEIESFTFTNEDPVSPICQELAGTTFAVGDADLDKYTPPMHHNCKSRLVPNYKSDDGNPEIDRGGVSLSKKALASITLSDHNHKHGRRKRRLL